MSTDLDDLVPEAKAEVVWLALRLYNPTSRLWQHERISRF
jgi:hypothetical protein